MHRRSIELYTITTILSKIQEGDSLSDIQLKTGLTFVTVQKTVRELEHLGILRTRINTTDRGRARECVSIVPVYKKIAEFYKDILSKTDEIFKSPREDGPLIFKLLVLERCLNGIKNILDEETAEVFEEWLLSPDGSVKRIPEPVEGIFSVEKNRIVFFPEAFNIKVRAERKFERKKEPKKVTLDMF
jgi:DNA-binding MarR family transcriptional regulator